MANSKRSYSTEWVFAPPDMTASKERIELVRQYFSKSLPSKTPRPFDITASTKSLSELDEPNKIISFPAYKELAYAPSEYMWAMQEWDGYVTAIEADKFIAVITVVGDVDGETESLEYPMAALSEKDRSNLVIGSIFRLSAGYSKKQTGQIRQQLSLLFRPKRKVLDLAKASAKPPFKLFKSIKQAPKSEIFSRE